MTSGANTFFMASMFFTVLGGTLHMFGWAAPYLWGCGWLSFMAALAGRDLIQSARTSQYFIWLLNELRR